MQFQILLKYISLCPLKENRSLNTGIIWHLLPYCWYLYYPHSMTCEVLLSTTTTTSTTTSLLTLLLLLSLSCWLWLQSWCLYSNRALCRRSDGYRHWLTLKCGRQKSWIGDFDGATWNRVKTGGGRWTLSSTHSDCWCSTHNCWPCRHNLPIKAQNLCIA